MMLFRSKKNLNFPFKNLKLIFSTIRSLLLSKTVYQGKEEYEKADIVEGKKKTLKISVQSNKIEGKNISFGFKPANEISAYGQ